MSTVTTSDCFIRSARFVTSLRPSPLGEKKSAPRTPTTGVAPLRRCATKNAPNVAATRARKTMRARRVTGGGWAAPRGALRSLVLAEDHDDVGAGRQVARVGVHPRDVGDVQPARDRARLRAG